MPSYYSFIQEPYSSTTYPLQSKEGVKILKNYVNIISSNNQKSLPEPIMELFRRPKRTFRDMNEAKYTLRFSKGIPKKLISKILDTGYYTINDNPEKSSDITLVNTLGKNPNPNMIHLSNQGRYTNRIISITKTLEDTNSIRKQLRLNNLKYNWVSKNPTSNKKVLQKYHVIILVSNREVSSLVDNTITEKKLYNLGSLIYLSSGGINNSNDILPGNVLNPNFVGAYQIYTTYWKKNTLEYIEPLQPIHYNDRLMSLVQRLFKQLGKNKFNPEIDYARRINRTEFNVSLLTKVPRAKPIIKGLSRMYSISPGFTGYVENAYRKALSNLGFLEVPISSSPYIPNNTQYDIVSYRLNKGLAKINNLDKAIMNASYMTNMTGAYSILNDKSIYYNAIKKISPKTVGKTPNQKINKHMRVPYTVDFDLKDPKIHTILKKMVKRKRDWILKPTQGTQGKGIFVFRSSGKNIEKDAKSLYKKLIYEWKNNTTSRDYSTWQIGWFIGNPLMFEPFGKLNYKALKNVSNKPRKSHVRFYMVIRVTSTGRLIHYVLPQALVFLAVLPYENCKKMFAKGEFGEKTGYCNQSNLTMGKEYFKEHKLTGNSYNLFSSLAEDAFDIKFGQHFYNEKILPQIYEIAQLTRDAVKKIGPEKLCDNQNSNTFEGCFQFIAVDILFDDGKYTNGIPQGWILEANMSPGLRGPQSIYGQFGLEEMVENIIKHGFGISGNYIKKEPKKIENEQEGGDDEKKKKKMIAFVKI